MNTLGTIGACNGGALCRLSESRKTVADTVVCYRLYAHVEDGVARAFYVTVCETHNAREVHVHRSSIEEAVTLYGVLSRGAVTLCHLANIVEDIDKEKSGAF